jgi:ubiquinone/menaquinone biosynthesis C-methylase UbiE
VQDYSKDAIKAVDAKFEAQKIAFSPLTFQAVRAMRELGLLAALSRAGEAGLSADEAAAGTGISPYGMSVLLEIGLGMNVIKTLPEAPCRYTLGKIGLFLLEDTMTGVNFDFVSDICYRGAAALTDSIKNGKPEGLREFGAWRTIYDALSSLPEKEKKSWFAFDHFYSDRGFEEALPIVFAAKPKKILDIGGNTAKWAIRCCRYDGGVEVTIADLPGQTAAAKKNAAEAGFAERIKTVDCDALDGKTFFPKGFDAFWMSQFLDCFSLKNVSSIIGKICEAASPDANIWVLEPFWDKQRFEAAAFSLQATSLYFTCMANGSSKMYRYDELAAAIEEGGAEVKEVHHNLGANAYSLLRAAPSRKNR